MYKLLSIKKEKYLCKEKEFVHSLDCRLLLKHGHKCQVQADDFLVAAGLDSCGAVMCWTPVLGCDQVVVCVTWLKYTMQN